MHADTLAIIADRALQKVLDSKGGMPVPFVFYVLGPPSIGKSTLQVGLFSRWSKFTPCFLQISSFVAERHIRLSRSLSECASEAYALTEIRSTLRKTLKREKILVRQYDHRTGTFAQHKVELTPSGFIYLEGPIWLKCLDIFSPGFTLFLYPKNIVRWKEAYEYRNMHFRNYRLHDAEKACRLALSGWIRMLSEAEIYVDLSVAVDFEGEDYRPRYELSNNRNTSEVAKWIANETTTLHSGKS